jgi:CSLREA domain-containing protein
MRSKMAELPKDEPLVSSAFLIFVMYWRDFNFQSKYVLIKGDIMVKSKRGIKVLLFLVFAWLLILVGSPALAKDITVTKRGDVLDAKDGKCTLREAIIAANEDKTSGKKKGECPKGKGADRVILKSGVYFLKIGDLNIIRNLTIIGKGKNKTFINGNGIDRVFHVRYNAKVTITGVTIQNGQGVGGGIWNSGRLTITNSTISNNSAVGDNTLGTRGIGGGIFNDGTLTVTNSTISNNSASTVEWTCYGGGIFNDGTLTVTNSIISRNSASSVNDYAMGGGIYNHWEGSTLTVTNSIISRNSALGFSHHGQGSGIYNNGGTVTVTQSTISNNSASGFELGEGGGILNRGKLTVSKSTISNNSASGVYVDGIGGGISNTGTVRVSNSTISNNSALSGNVADGGGIFNDGTLTVSKSTISNNSSSGEGGGIHNGGTLTIKKVSKIVRNFASEVGGGVCNHGTIRYITTNSNVSGNIPNNIYEY